MDYNQIIKFFISTSIVTSGLVYLAKLILDKLAEAKIEKYKNSLQHDTEDFKHELNIETEKFKQELNKTTVEHQIRYSKLYEERGHIIKLTYNLLYELEVSLINLTTMGQGPEWTTDTEKDKIATEKIVFLQTYLEQNRIFFSKELCNIIEGILKESYQVTVDMHIAKINEKSNNQNFDRTGNYISTTQLLSPLKTWREQNSKVQNDIKNERLKLAQEFRNLIGVE
jgi:hypothetical protein